MKTILVTGAGGILGNEILRQAIKEDIHITALTSQSAMLLERYGYLHRQSFFDWTDLDSIPFCQIDTIIHCAFARTEDGNSLHLALERTKELLRRTRKSAHHTAFINISSRSVYGQNPSVPWTEQSEVSPNSLYAIAKAAQELLVAQAGEAYGFPYTNLRLSGLIGVGMETRLISKLVQQTIEEHSFKLIGGMQQFAMLDIRDAAAGILALTAVPPLNWKSLYNLGSTKCYTLGEIADIIWQYAKEHYGWDIQIKKEIKDIQLLDAMDSSQFYRDVGWTPGYSLAETVDLLFQYYCR